MNSSESAEAVVKISLEVGEVAAKIVGTGVERLAVAIYTIAKDKKMTKGKTKLNNMLKSGSPLQIFSLKEGELKKFHEESKKYGVLYTALIDKKHPDLDGMVDIMVRAEDAPKVNRIVERFKLSAVDMASIKTEIEKDKIEEMIKDAKERGVEVKSDEEKLADDIMSKPIQKEKNEMPNPNVAMAEKNPLSELSSENKKNLGVATNQKKPSVRETLKKIKEEQKENSKSDVVKEEKTSKNIEKSKVDNKEILTNDYKSKKAKKGKAR